MVLASTGDVMPPKGEIPAAIRDVMKQGLALTGRGDKEVAYEGPPKDPHYTRRTVLGYFALLAGVAMIVVACVLSHVHFDALLRLCEKLQWQVVTAAGIAGAAIPVALIVGATRFLSSAERLLMPFSLYTLDKEPALIRAVTGTPEPAPTAVQQLVESAQSFKTVAGAVIPGGGGKEAK